MGGGLPVRAHYVGNDERHELFGDAGKGKGVTLVKGEGERSEEGAELGVVCRGGDGRGVVELDT